MPTLDTNILLRWLLDDVPDQTDAVERLLAGGVRCFVPDVTLIETVYVLERVLRLPRTTIAASIELILEVANLELDRPLWKSAVEEYLAHPKLSIADTFLAAQATSSMNTPLYTFARKLANQLPGAELLR